MPDGDGRIQLLLWVSLYTNGPPSPLTLTNYTYKNKRIHSKLHRLQETTRRQYITRRFILAFKQICGNWLLSPVYINPSYFSLPFVLFFVLFPFVLFASFTHLYFLLIYLHFILFFCVQFACKKRYGRKKKTTLYDPMSMSFSQ